MEKAVPVIEPTAAKSIPHEDKDEKAVNNLLSMVAALTTYLYAGS